MEPGKIQSGRYRKELNCVLFIVASRMRRSATSDRRGWRYYVVSICWHVGGGAVLDRGLENPAELKPQTLGGGQWRLRSEGKIKH